MLLAGNIFQFLKIFLESHMKEFISRIQDSKPIGKLLRIAFEIPRNVFLHVSNGINIIESDQSFNNDSKDTILCVTLKANPCGSHGCKYLQKAQYYSLEYTYHHFTDLILINLRKGQVLKERYICSPRTFSARQHLQKSCDNIRVCCQVNTSCDIELLNMASSSRMLTCSDQLPLKMWRMIENLY